MFFGGTNFGFTAGANDFGETKYTPDITSYDYDALLNEWGNTTEKFDLVRQVIGRYFRLPALKPVKEKTFAYGRVDLRPILHLLSAEGRSLLGTSKTHSTVAKSFEELDLFSGLLLYETDIEHSELENALLSVNDLRDRAFVFVDQELQGILSRQKGIFSLNLNKTFGSTLQILVENQGRINYNVANDTKGIMGVVTLKPANGSVVILKNWQHTAFPLQDINLNSILYNSTRQVLPENSNLLLQGPVIYYGEFAVNKPHHTFLNPTGWGKGVAYVNGFNLGRYWPLAGPQLTLYVPQEILVKGRNTLVLIEYEQSNSVNKEMASYATLDNKPQLDN